MKAPKTLKRLWGFFPSKLPVGKTDFEKFTTDILSTYDLPDLPSYRQSVATMVMHLPQLQTFATKRFFAKSITKAMANQVAYEIIQDIRDAAKLAEQAAKDAAIVAAHDDGSAYVTPKSE